MKCVAPISFVRVIWKKRKYVFAPQAGCSLKCKVFLSVCMYTFYLSKKKNENEYEWFEHFWVSAFHLIAIF